MRPLAIRLGRHERSAGRAGRATRHDCSRVHGALQRLRQRVGQRLRAAVAETVATEDEVDVELRHLIAAVSGDARPPRP